MSYELSAVDLFPGRPAGRLADGSEAGAVRRSGQDIFAKLLSEELVRKDADVRPLGQAEGAAGRSASDKSASDKSARGQTAGDKTASDKSAASPAELPVDRGAGGPSRPSAHRADLPATTVAVRGEVEPPVTGAGTRAAALGAGRSAGAAVDAVAAESAPIETVIARQSTTAAATGRESALAPRPGQQRATENSGRARAARSATSAIVLDATSNVATVPVTDPAVPRLVEPALAQSEPAVATAATEAGTPAEVERATAAPNPAVPEEGTDKGHRRSSGEPGSADGAATRPAAVVSAEPTVAVPTPVATPPATTSTVPTSAATTSAVPTSDVPTSAATTSDVPTSHVPTSHVPTSAVPTSAVPTSHVPTSAVPTSAVPTLAATTSAVPTSAVPTSAATTSAATTSAVPTPAATTSAATTSAATTSAATTQSVPTSDVPTSAVPTSAVPTSAVPTSADTSAVPTSAATSVGKPEPPASAARPTGSDSPDTASRRSFHSADHGRAGAAEPHPQATPQIPGDQRSTPAPRPQPPSAPAAALPSPAATPVRGGEQRSSDGLSTPLRADSTPPDSMPPLSTNPAERAVDRFVPSGFASTGLATAAEGSPGRPMVAAASAAHGATAPTIVGKEPVTQGEPGLAVPSEAASSSGSRPVGPALATAPGGTQQPAPLAQVATAVNAPSALSSRAGSGAAPRSATATTSTPQGTAANQVPETAVVDGAAVAERFGEPPPVRSTVSHAVTDRVSATPPPAVAATLTRDSAATLSASTPTDPAPPKRSEVAPPDVASARHPADTVRQPPPELRNPLAPSGITAGNSAAVDGPGGTVGPATAPAGAVVADASTPAPQPAVGAASVTRGWRFVSQGRAVSAAAQPADSQPGADANLASGRSTGRGPAPPVADGEPVASPEAVANRELAPIDADSTSLLPAESPRTEPLRATDTPTTAIDPRPLAAQPAAIPPSLGAGDGAAVPVIHGELPEALANDPEATAVRIAKSPAASLERSVPDSPVEGAGEVFQRIALGRDPRLFLGANGREMRIAVARDEIGTVHVRSRLHDERLTTTLRAEREDVGQALLGRMGELHKSLSDLQPTVEHRLEVQTGAGGWDGAGDGPQPEGDRDSAGSTGRDGRSGAGAKKSANQTRQAPASDPSRLVDLRA